MGIDAMELGLFIDNKQRSARGGGMLDSIDPATGEVFARVAEAREQDIDDAVEAAQHARAGWRRTVPVERGRILMQLARRLTERREELARLETLDTGQTLAFSRNDIDTAARYFEFYGAAADKFHGEQLPLGPKYLSYTRNEPFGVVGIVTPWNAPINQAARGVAPALAAGNTVVLKPAESTPITSIIMAEIAAEVGLPDGVLNVVPGYGKIAGEALTSHPLVRKVAFTGSVITGKRIMRVAADRLIPLTLELGGKSPNIVFADADLDAVATSSWQAFTFKSGQACSAGTRLLVQESIRDELVDRLVAIADAAVVGPGLDESDIGPLANANQYEKVCSYLQIGKDEGATVATGGSSAATGELASGYFVQPTIFTNVTNSMRIAREEIFGPVLSVITFNSDQEAIDIANDTEYGLAAGVWTSDIGRAHRVSAEIEAGQVFVNEYYAGGVETPFGGFKQSGFGREKGFEALHHYVQTKTVTVKIDG